METEKAIEILKYELDKSKVCKKYQNNNADFLEDLDEYIEALETVLKELEKKDKMIELLIEDLQGEGCLNMTREEIDNYYERRIKLAEGVE